MERIRQLTVSDKARIHEAARVVTNDLQHALTIKVVARRVGITEKKLKIGFKALFGMGVHAYLRQVRLERVKVMLMSNAPLKSIVRATGFKNESSLTKTFKKVIGMTTREWKNSQEMQNVVE